MSIFVGTMVLSLVPFDTVGFWGRSSCWAGVQAVGNSSPFHSANTSFNTTGESVLGQPLRWWWCVLHSVSVIHVLQVTATTREWSWWCTVHPQASLLFEEADAVSIVLVLLCLFGGLSYCQGWQLFTVLTRVTSKILVIWDETEILAFVDKEYKAYLLPSTISFIKVWFLCYWSSAVVTVVLSCWSFAEDEFQNE